MKPNQRIFCCLFPTGVSWSDRHRLVNQDYADLAFMPYDTLVLKFQPDCPAELRAEIEQDAAAVQAKRGTEYRISTSGQTVMLGKPA